MSAIGALLSICTALGLILAPAAEATQPPLELSAVARMLLGDQSRQFAMALDPDVACSSPLKLRDGQSQTGTTVSIYTRGLWINLADVGFDNRTSSYTVGACAVELAALANGGGARYPRCLQAWCVENVMFTGWNNVVSSVYLR